MNGPQLRKFLDGVGVVANFGTVQRSGVWWVLGGGWWPYPVIKTTRLKSPSPLVLLCGGLTVAKI